MPANTNGDGNGAARRPAGRGPSPAKAPMSTLRRTGKDPYEIVGALVDLESLQGPTDMRSQVDQDSTPEDEIGDWQLQTIEFAANCDMERVERVEF